MTRINRKSKKIALLPEPPKAQAGAAHPVAASPAKAPAPRTNRVSLQLVKPGARQVFVAGSFNEWKPERTPLSHRGNGCWVGDLAVGAGRHEYLFVVDGQWLPDPNAKESVQNPFGGKNSLLVVSE
jgi:1,4-alpha-glucan branching enzyme